MRTQHLQTIREAAVKANPNIQEQEGHKCRHHDGLILNRSEICTCGPVRLAEVILALEDHKQDYIPDATLAILCQIYWNLRKDELALQDDECLEFLANLLSV
jgi:hypothetical protein